MTYSHHQRENGSSLLVVLVALSFILALAGAVSLVAANDLKASTRSTDMMEAFYAADAAAQVGNALVRSTGIAMQAISFQETLGDDHLVQVDVTEEDVGLYKVISTSDVNGEVSTVELWVNFDQEDFDVAPNGGFETNIGDNVNLNGDIRVDLKSNSIVSGFDHDANGNELADQTNGVPGLVMQATAGDRDFNLSTFSNAEAVGTPQATANDAEAQGDLMNTLRDIAQTTADVFVTGTTLLEDAANGSYGTAADPVLVYVSLGQNEELRLDSNFEGFGFLVIDAGKNAEFEMNSNAQWNGMVLVRSHGDPSTGNGPLVKLDDNAKIIGSLQLMLDINGTHASGHKVLELDDNAEILFSSSLIDEIFHGDADTQAIPLQQVTGVNTFRR